MKARLLKTVLAGTLLKAALFVLAAGFLPTELKDRLGVPALPWKAETLDQAP